MAFSNGFRREDVRVVFTHIDKSRCVDILFYHEVNPKTLKLLTDPTRLRIINVLNEESLSVAELQEILGMGQSRISTQLAQLRQEGVVEDTRSGKNVFYTLSLANDLHNVALKACEELLEAETDKKALQVILDKRKNRTQAYFDEVVCRLGKNYAPGRSWKALAGALLRILNYDVVADLGAGEGFVSQLISPSAKQVIAVDNSPSMVELGQELARKHGLSVPVNDWLYEEIQRIEASYETQKTAP